MLKRAAGVAVAMAMGFAILAMGTMIEAAPPRPAAVTAAAR